MKTKKTIIATSVALMMCASYAASAAKKAIEYHEDQWGKVISYGNTPIAGDSAADWGPWSDFVQPAAGAPSVGFLPQGAGEPYRPLPVPVIPPVDSGCEAGMACGYAAFAGYGGSYSNGKSTIYGDGGEHPATFTARIPPTLDDSATTAWRLTSLDGTAPIFPESGELGNAGFKGNSFSFSRDDSVDGAKGRAWIDGYVSDDGSNSVARGYFGRYLSSYMRGDGCVGECDSSYDQTYGVFVAGIVTSATDMSALRADNVSAVYNGSAFQGAPVTINVNFGPGTWNGSWNNGADGSTSAYTTYPAGAQEALRGHVGFNASGTITGSNIQSTSVSATDGTVSGMVRGSFFGSQAAALGGVVDITKTKTQPTLLPATVGNGQPSTYTNARHVDLFLTTKGGNDNSSAGVILTQQPN